MTSNHQPSLIYNRFITMLRPDYPLCREDVIWMLEIIKKKMNDDSPALSQLPQPQLLRLFQAFADVSMMIIKDRQGSGTEIERIRRSLQEAVNTLEL